MIKKPIILSKKPIISIKLEVGDKICINGMVLVLRDIWEDGDWLKIEDQQGDIRYLPKAEARAVLIWLGQHSQKEKSDIVLIAQSQG